jgi:dihydrofolate reductase
VRKVINSTYISLDGVIENPQDWPSLGSVDDAGTRIQTDLLMSCDAVLMGRRTYEGFAPVWSGRSGDVYTDRINSMDKYVVSSTLTAPEWNNTTVITGDVVAEVAKLKEAPGRDIVQYGFGEVSRALLAAGLLDELRLWVHPFFVGAASEQDLLFRAGAPASFELVDSTTLASGIIIATYRFR